MGDGGRTRAVPRDLTLHTVDTTESTNTDVLRLARQGAAEGLWLRAGQQTAGRGRQGRAWVSPPGNLYASTLVRLRPGDPAAATLALVAAVALHDAIGTFAPNVAVRIKWPNDVLIDGGKVSGILLERSDDAVVVGLGVNLAHHPDLADRATTSLAAHGVTVAAGTFLDVLADGFARWLARWRGEGFDAIRRAWMAAAHPRGTALTSRLADGTVEQGLFDGLDRDGALILRLASGERRVIHAADVFLA